MRLDLTRLVGRRHTRFDPFLNHRTVLVVDDDAFSGALVGDVLMNLGATVHLCHHESEIPTLMATHKYDLVILDWSLRQVDANPVLKDMDKRFVRKGLDPRLPVVVYTGKDYRDIEIPRLQNIRIVDHWLKPITMSEITKKSLRLFGVLQ